MIISASRRTDIPSYYSEWFINRIKEEHVLVRNPMNFSQISEVSLKKEDVECIVFWTKNPFPMLKNLSELKEYNYYFQFSLTSYDNSIEKNLPPKSKLVPIFKRLSSLIGSEKVIWRYDPILISKKFDVNYHKENFELLAKKLKNSTNKCVISFIDVYPKIAKKLLENGIREPHMDEISEISKTISEIGSCYNIEIQTCSEKIDLNNYGIIHGKCIDDELIKKLFGYSGKVPKDKNQREECGCVKSIDIGAYDTCVNGCIYCYANSKNKISTDTDINSHILGRDIKDDAIINEKKIDIHFSNQINSFKL